MSPSKNHRRLPLAFLFTFPVIAAAQPASMTMSLLDVKAGTAATPVSARGDAGSDRLPARAARPRVVVDLGRQRAFLVVGDTIQKEYVISSGRAGFETRPGTFVISSIKRNSWWYPPDAPWARALKPIPPGPDNPMGPVKMQLSGSDVYLHGIPTKAEARLGTPASHGCVRLRTSDALDLASRVKVGTRVVIVSTSEKSS